MSTDGIDMSQIPLEGMNLLCLGFFFLFFSFFFFPTFSHLLPLSDFAGQDLYKYTHQLFLVGVGLYLMVFSIARPEAISYKQICFWYESIFHRATKGKLVMVGTHLGSVDEKIAKRRFQNLKQRFIFVVFFILSFSFLLLIFCSFSF